MRYLVLFRADIFLAFLLSLGYLLPHILGLDDKILWWTSLTGDYRVTKTCGSWTCVFTDNRDIVNDSKAILFYGSNLNYTDLPLPRPKNQIWGLLHEESPKNVPFLQHEIILHHWNYTSTFSRYSDVPLTLQYLKNLDALITTKYFLPVKEKNRIKNEMKLASVVYLQSHCDSPSGREEYIKELMQYIDIDSYGQCLNNKQLPKSLTEDYMRTIDSDELHNFLKSYKFILAFENAACNDYITEKFWRPITIGSIPIYFGSQTIEDWLPNDKSAILVKDFSSPKEVANLIKYLDNNDNEYNSYLRHKLMGRKGITNQYLIQKIDEWTERSEEGLFNDFECFVCEEIHKDRPEAGVCADGSHYDCGEEFVLPKMNARLENFYWRNIMESEKNVAKALNQLLITNQPFTKHDFDKTFNQILALGYSTPNTPTSKHCLKQGRPPDDPVVGTFTVYAATFLVFTAVVLFVLCRKRWYSKFFKNIYKSISGAVWSTPRGKFFKIRKFLRNRKQQKYKPFNVENKDGI
ncbi:unnamed protein product [Hermetia illucens]|uniref:Fucosyltransferase n=1 Tax=Hermetia illucens TaxID=343691 RepID=A0A7R8YVD8_HERIL|nr:alpha-(1,3)-fucosyltransferase B isoform X2 [Hermetia illucens]CAD7086239.1 unnamed protein product [Hermetia illucens]